MRARLICLGWMHHVAIQSYDCSTIRFSPLHETAAVRSAPPDVHLRLSGSAHSARRSAGRVMVRASARTERPERMVREAKLEPHLPTVCAGGRAQSLESDVESCLADSQWLSNSGT